MNIGDVMLKVFKSAACLGLAAFIIAPASFAGETVELNKTHLLRLPSPAAAIIVGDPAIADVSVHSDDMIFILGRGYGETDLLVLDAVGNVMLHSDISVIAGHSRSNVNLIKAGSGTETYHCAPYCQPSPRLGNDPVFANKFKSDGGTITNGAANLSEPAQTETVFQSAPETFPQER